MNQEWENIDVVKGKKFASVTTDELKEISSKYPYSFLHQFLYSKKLKESDDVLYKKQASKTALYSSNLPWLDFILNNDGTQNIIVTDVRLEELETSSTYELTDNISMNQELIETDEESFAENELPESNSLVSSILDREKEIARQETELKFEPLHTVDYFASQGIKQVSETLPSDKLGKQLRSFTEWLKIMKRLPAEEAVEINETDEKKIRTEAEDSNTAKEVITEAMADVLLKQGKTQKAIEIYHKLSLQHPEKSPYFAALIDQLKA
ncbi:MAG: hypothetical protein HYX40_10340 [Sphingobacteriales bacterium]|nr:hypothetical protein [Sphingobacteriales bacterium]